MSHRSSWVPYAALLVLSWGVWGAFSGLPTTRYGYPDEMVYVLWSLTMLVPASFALRGAVFDRRPVATRYGLVIGLTGAGGQLLLFHALTIGPAYLIFPVIALSPAITVLMAVVLLRERLPVVAGVGVVLALLAVLAFSASTDGEGATAGPWLLMAAGVSVAWGVQAYFMRPRLWASTTAPPSGG